MFDPEMFSYHGIMFFNALMEVAASAPNIICIHILHFAGLSGGGFSSVTLR